MSGSSGLTAPQNKAWIYKHSTRYFMQEQLMRPPQKDASEQLCQPTCVLNGDVGVEGPLFDDERLEKCALLRSSHHGGNKQLVPVGDVMAAVQEVWPDCNKTSAELTSLPRCTRIDYEKGVYFEIGEPVAKKAPLGPDSQTIGSAQDCAEERFKVSTDRKKSKQQFSRWAISFQEQRQTQIAAGLPRCLAYIVTNVFLRRGAGGRPGGKSMGCKRATSFKRPAPFVRLWLPKS